MQLVRDQHTEVGLSPPAAAQPATAEVILSRAQRAHARLSWEERLARNARLKLLAKSRSGCSVSQRPLLPCSDWRRLNSVLTADGVLLLGQAGFSEGASCPLFPAGSRFFLSAACFALPLPALAGSDGLPVRFCMTFAYRSTISSSTRSLRIAWDLRQPASLCAISLLAPY